MKPMFVSILLIYNFYLLTNPSCTKTFYLTALPTASALAVFLKHSHTPQTTDIGTSGDGQVQASKDPLEPDRAHTCSPSTWENQVEEHN